MPVILATQEAEIRRIAVQSQPGQIVQETLSQKKPFTQKGWWRGSSVAPEFKPQYGKKKKCFSKIVASCLIYRGNDTRAH
jgi:hypothetical protein